jgi:hypothetical protein
MYAANTGFVPSVDKPGGRTKVASKVVTFRLSEDQVKALETVATFDGVALAEEIREGIELLLEARRSDPEFRQRVQDAIGKAQDLLGDVEGGGEVLEALRPRVDLTVDDGAAAIAEPIAAR